MASEYPYRWRGVTQLPHRRGQRCRIKHFDRNVDNNYRSHAVAVEFEDGLTVDRASRAMLRRIKVGEAEE